MNHTINKERNVVYVALNFLTGISDLVVAIRKPDGSTFTPAPTIIEQGDGVYTFSYTPDTTGSWQEKISSASNGDLVFRKYEVVSYDVDDLQSQADGIETKVDSANTAIGVVDGKVDSVQTDVTAIDGKVDSVQTDVTAIDGKVDSVQTDVTAIDGKVDTANTKLDSLDTKIDSLGTEIKPGGYFAG